MRVHKFFVAASFVTLVSVLYVYQQTRILNLAYTSEKRMRVFQELLDKNNLLRYNVDVLTSLSSMGSKVLEKSEFEMPAASKVVKVEAPQEKIAVLKNKFAEVFNIFSLKSQAEAKPISH